MGFIAYAKIAVMVKLGRNKNMRFLLDTNILMSTENYEKLFKDYEGHELIIGGNVIEELDHIKIREGAPGYQARRAIKAIMKYYDKFVFVGESQLKEDKVDNQIIESASKNAAVVLTNDVNVQLKAKAFYGLEVDFYNQQKKTIKFGHTDLSITEKEFLEDSYAKPILPYGMYLIIQTEVKNRVFKSYGEGEFVEVLPQNMGNVMLGTVSPKDVYQVCAIDSLVDDTFTILTGKAGTGKTLLSLTYALREIISGKRRKLIIFVNPVKTRGSEQLGFYTGDRTAKLMQNSIGAILTSKLGGLEAIEELMDNDQLEILPISDIRGFEVGQDEIMYITEAQNLNIELIKLAIQRCAEGAKIILEGDPTTQVDHFSFEGEGNGLVRAIEVFEGFYKFSHVNLPIIYRSEMADRAELM